MDGTKTIIVDPIVLEQEDGGTLIRFQDPLAVTGKKPPANKPNWWPWLIGAGVVLGLLYLTREGGRRGPFGA